RKRCVEVLGQSSRAESADPSKVFQVIQASKERLGAAHRQSRDSSGLAVFCYPISRLDLRYDFAEQSLTKLREVSLAEAGVAKRRNAPGEDLRSAVAEGHNNDHGFGLAASDEVVENHVRAPDSSPGARIIAETVEKVQNRISLIGSEIVTGWRIDIEISIIAHGPRPVELVVEGAVGYIVHLPRQRSRSGHMHDTPGVEQVGRHQGIGGVDQTDTVGHERITVEIGLERLSCDTPNTLLIFLHGQRCCALSGDGNGFSVWITEPESNAAVRAYFW